MNGEKKLIGTTILAAIAASLCCITPVLALIAGTSGIASTFSWIEPFRPYLIGITILVLVFAWYQKLKPEKQEADCECEEDEKPKFIQSKTFLGIVTLFAALMLAFPYYSGIFYPDNKTEVIVMDKSDVQTADFNIKGMTCTACEEHVKHAVNQLPGIVNVTANYENGTATVAFDERKTNKQTIADAINKTGYKVVVQAD